MLLANTIGSGVWPELSCWKGEFELAKSQRGPIEFTAEGRGQFPVDMLRYDRCYPKTTNDAVALTGDQQRTVKLVSYRDTGFTREPTKGRWESFGWRVVQ
jgi:hypothetical protein